MGLITSDGSLSCDGRHINITSKDFIFLKELKNTLGLINKVGTKNKNKINQAYQIQFSNVRFYDFLLSIGLTQNKSLTLGAIEVPNQHFIDFLRGLIDGDGSIRRWIHPTNNREQWSLRIYSGSEKFVKWLDGAITLLLRVHGKIHKERTTKTKWVLKYGKMAAREIAKKCYYKHALGLKRKMKLAQECIVSYRGWQKSKTVFGENN